MTTPVSAQCRKSLLCAFAVVSLAPLSVLAQNSSHPDESPIQLSEFTVSANSDQGYGASETMTGMRVATQIKDLPFQVNVVTNEFFEDFAMFEINDNVAGYISNFSGLDQGGGFTLRGLGSTYQLRDGFFRLGRYGTSNIERIEVIKGPSAAIYGQSQPTGMVNIISKRPRKTPHATIRVSTGSYDTNREGIEATGPVGNSTKDFYLLSGQVFDRTYDTPFAAEHNKEGYLAWEHDFDSSSSFLGQVEYFLSVHDSIPPALPLIQDATTKQILGIDTRFRDINQGGPTQNSLTRGMTSLTGTYEKRFSPVWSVRVAGNYYRARRWDLGVPSSNYVTTAGVLTRGAQLGIGRIVEDGGGIQSDLLAHYYLANHKIELRDLATIDINDYYRYDPSYQQTGPAATAWASLRNITVGQPVVYWTAPFDYSNAKLSRMNKNRTLIYGGLFRHQMAFFNGRLLTYAGIRFDHVIFSLRDILNQKQAHFTSDAKTPNLGANFKVLPNLATYVNYSQAFNPAGQKANASNIVPNETGWGYDYGIKSSLLHDRLNFTLGGFYIVKKNVTVSDIDPITGLTINIPEGSQLIRGIEFDSNYHVTDGLTLGASYGHVNSQITNLGYQTMSVGRSPANVTPTQVGAYGKYFFSGILKGVSTNLGVVYRSATPTQGPSAGDSYKTGVYQSTTNEWKTTVPAWAVWSGAVRYSFRTNRAAKLEHTIALNVNNIFNRYYLSGRSIGEGRSYYLNYTLKF